MYKALLFDFDGTTLDTETPECASWQEIYAQHGVAFPLDAFHAAVGKGYDPAIFEPAYYLSEALGASDLYEEIRQEQRRIFHGMLQELDCRDGVRDWITDAISNEIRLAVASSSPRIWVDTHTERLGIKEHFDVFATRDDVAPGRRKPHPDIFEKACELLDIRPSEALVIEDSQNGAIAAHAAGCDCIVCPNPMTAHMTFTKHALIVASLSEWNPVTVYKHFRG
jgi:putative hydrolase of the HAD superfamily